MTPTLHPHDLTGQWHGTYAYPRGLGPATPFLANIIELDGSFSGTIIEPDAYYKLAENLESLIAGHRGGRAIDFTKTYRSKRHGYENPVDYVGQMSPDGKSITGVWCLLDINGTFEMFRENGIAETARTSASVEVDVMN